MSGLAVENFDEWLSGVEIAVSGTVEEAEQSLVKLGEDIGARMRRKGPRRKGASRHGIDTVEVTKGRSGSVFFVDVGPTDRAWYLAFGEFGSRHEPARPWARPSIAEAVTSWQ